MRRPSPLLPAGLLSGLAALLSVLPASAERAPAESAELPAETDELEAGCDSAAGGEADVQALLAEERNSTIETEPPRRWRPSEGRQCHRHQGRVMCEGPRRVPEPFGPAAELAARLGINDDVRMGRRALSGEPAESWRQAVQGEMGAGLLWPVPGGRRWRGFGMQREILPRRGRGRLRRGRRQHLHRGVDIGAHAGAHIRAVNDGLVLYSYNSMRGYGNSVVLLHPDGTVTLYAHCRATYVFAGQQVRRGQVIAEVGHTGLAHGDHLHFEWRRDGRPMNPSRHFVAGPEPREAGVSIER